MQVLASQLHFLANTNAELAIPPLFWPVNCIKIEGHVALLSDPTVYSLYCDCGSTKEIYLKFLFKIKLLHNIRDYKTICKADKKLRLN